MKTSLTCLALLGCTLFTASISHAAFDAKVVSADAQWVFSADLNALRTSVIGKELMTTAEKFKFDTGAGTLGVDMQKLAATIGSVTGYGTSFSAEATAVDGILVVRGTPDLPKIAEAALIQMMISKPEQVSEIKDLPFPAYAVTNSTSFKDAPAMQVFVAFPPEAAVLVGKSKPQLIKARDVLRGKEPSLNKNATSKLTPLLENSNGAFLFAASMVPSDKFFAEDAPQARVLQMATAGSISIGETGPLTFAHLQLLASSDEMADRLIKILQGMTAMASLAETNDKQLSDFINSAAVTKKDNSVTLHVAYDSERLVQMAKNLQQGHEASAPRAPVASRTAGEWKLSELAQGPDGITWKTLDSVHLGTKATLSLSAKSYGQHPRLDRIEIIPAAGGAAQVFRGEYLRPSVGWSIDPTPTASGGKTIRLTGSAGTLRVQFPGEEGDYTVRIGTLNEAADNTAFTLGVRDSSLPAVKSKSQE